MAFKSNKKPVKIKNAVSYRQEASLLTLLPWQSFEGVDHLLRLADENGDKTGYMEMLSIEGKDLDFVYGIGSDGAGRIIQDYHTLLNTYLDDFDIIITKMPANTMIQQRSWINIRDQVSTELQNETDVRKRTQLQHRYQIADEQIGRLKIVQDSVAHQAYTVFLYGKTPSETRELRDKFMGSGGRAINTKRISLDQKKHLLSMLQDPTQQLTD